MDHSQLAEGKRPNEPNYGREAFILGVGMKGYPARNFNQSYGIVKSLIGSISSSTYRDNAKRRSRFQQQPVKTKVCNCNKTL